MQKIIILIFVFCLAGCNRQPKVEAAHIQVIAHKYAFEPVEIHVKKGQEVTLEISTTDVQHSFSVKGLGIDEPLQLGKPAVVSFRSDKAGEYPVECSIICGPGHDRMKAKIIVE